MDTGLAWILTRVGGVLTSFGPQILLAVLAVSLLGLLLGRR